MALDKWIAVFFLVCSVIYGYAAFTYPLLPFERNMSFLPNTMPMALSILGVVVAAIIIFSPRNADEESGSTAEINLSNLKEYKIGQALAILVAMTAYALLLRPIGFIPATVFFLVGCGYILGERKWHLMIGVALVGTVGIWYLVQEVLGIFLRPLPSFLMGA